MRNLAFEYRTTFAVIPPVFPDYSRISEDLSKISPKPPKGEDWRLVSSVAVNGSAGPCTVLYFWERAATPPLSDTVSL